MHYSMQNKNVKATTRFFIHLTDFFLSITQFHFFWRSIDLSLGTVITQRPYLYLNDNLVYAMKWFII